MQQITNKDLAPVKSFIKKLDDSVVKSNIEAIFTEVEDKSRISSEQMGKFVSLANQLPVEHQAFPQEFAHSFKMISNENEELAAEDVAAEEATTKQVAATKKADAKVAKTDEKGIAKGAAKTTAKATPAAKTQAVKPVIVKK